MLYVGSFSADQRRNPRRNAKFRDGFLPVLLLIGTVPDSATIRLVVKPVQAISKAKLVFHLFDSNKSGKISKGEILDVLRYMVGANIGAENLEAIAERCLVEVRFSFIEATLGKII